MLKKYIIFSIVLLLSISCCACTKADKNLDNETSTNNIASYFGNSVRFNVFDTNSKSISNVKIEIIKDDEVLDTLTTDDTGKVNSKNIDSGKYFYKVISVPEGYILDSTEYDFEIRDLSLEVDVEIEKEN